MAKTFDPTRVQVERQLQGMGCERYEIGVRSANGMLIKTWTPAQVIAALKWLRHENANGADIYVRPARDENAALVLLDDLDRETVGRLRSGGLTPAVVVETSPSNFQAWIRLGRREEKLDAATRARVARYLAQHYGADPNSADAIHFGRLAGFTNRKPQHAYNGVFPFVVLHSYAGGVAENANEVLGALATAKASNAGVQIIRMEAFNGVKQQEAGLPAEVSSEDVEHLVSWYNAQWDRLREHYSQQNKWDANRADFLLSRLLLGRGCDVLTVARVMLRHAGIARKHNAVDYVARTVCKAQIGDVADALEKARPCIQQLKNALSEYSAR